MPHRRLEKLTLAQTQLLQVAAEQSSGSKVEVQSVDVTSYEKVGEGGKGLYHRSQ